MTGSRLGNALIWGEQAVDSLVWVCYNGNRIGLDRCLVLPALPYLCYWAKESDEQQEYVLVGGGYDNQRVDPRRN